MYKFTKIDKDTTKLECDINGEHKEFEIKKTVELLKELTSATHRSRNRLIKDLAKEGLSKSDLVKETKKDGKTYYDSSSWDELEQSYYEEENQIILSNVVEKITGYDIITLVVEMGLSEKEIEEFSTELVVALTGSKVDTPSKS
jgi:hypothetical protein